MQLVWHHSVLPLWCTHTSMWSILNHPQGWIPPFHALRHLNWTPKVSCQNLVLKGKHCGEKFQVSFLLQCFLKSSSVAVPPHSSYIWELKTERPKILGTLFFISIKWRKMKIASIKPTVLTSNHLLCAKILWHLWLQKALTMSFPALCLCGAETSFSFWRCAK